MTASELEKSMELLMTTCVLSNGDILHGMVPRTPWARSCHIVLPSSQHDRDLSQLSSQGWMQLYMFRTAVSAWAGEMAPFSAGGVH